MGDRITYIGLDVHKEAIVVAVAEGGLRGEVREYGRVANTPTALRRLAGKLGREGADLRFCYEAGPCGYGIQRHLRALGWLSAPVSRIVDRGGPSMGNAPAGGPAQFASRSPPATGKPGRARGE